jgi:transcriptional regulator with PAS, ATPase and Fis domain
VYDLKETIVGVSPSIVALRDYLPKVARSKATVLITGETGTGKDQVAEILHSLGPRSHRPFVAINCAAMPDGLVESELFGHEKGSFTGAIGTSKGHILRSNGGTLFLDEIGEMSPYAQAKLLRVIETREVMPVGADKPISVDVRIIAATNQLLENLVEMKRFRADLFYRLNVARLDLPALKDRKEDIPLLLNNAIEELNRRDHCSVGPPEGELLECLMAHDWPGNIRELRNLVEAIFIDPPRGRITLNDLPPVSREVFGRYRMSNSEERDLLVAALRKTQWNKAEAAKQLSWSRMTLYRKMAKYQIA